MALNENTRQNNPFLVPKNHKQGDFMHQHATFEQEYLRLRQKEKRLYPDELVKELPDVPNSHPLRGEWHARKKSTARMISYLQKGTGKRRILEIGCGNGWLSARLARLEGTEVVGLDINRDELTQAARVFFPLKNLTFVYADVFDGWDPRPFDYIILASSIQYFRDVTGLLYRLNELLEKNGEIHIVDSPWYSTEDVICAKKRSMQYFELQGSGMAAYYFHHDWQAMAAWNPKLLYNPHLLFNKIKRLIFADSPFPWIRIDERPSSKAGSREAGCK